MLNADFFEFEKIEKNYFSVYCPSSEPPERQRDKSNEGLNVIFITTRAVGECVLDAQQQWAC